MSLGDELRDITRRQRVYASLREGGTKGQKEMSVLQDLLESMARHGQQLYADPQLSREDPPDCTARNAAGGLVAIEVTELVSQDAVEINERARPAPGEQPPIDQMVMAQWTRDAFVAQVAQLLASKDQKSYLGGPYAGYVVVVHTEEPLLIREHAEAWLSPVIFGPYRQLTGAYLLYPYEGNYGYPFQALVFGGA